MSYRLSPSTINLFFDCPRCFWLKVNRGVERPSPPFPSLPNGMDREIKSHFDRFRGGDRLPPELRGSGLDAEPVDDRQLLEKARDWRSEPRWKDPRTGAVLRGAVDELLQRDDELIVMDYKTRGYPPKQDTGAPDYYRRQVNLYNLMLQENGFNTAGFGLILYYHPDQVNSDGEFVFHRELRKIETSLAEARENVREAVKTLESELPRHSSKCKYSEWMAGDR